MAAALPGPGFYDSCMGEQALAEVAAQLYALPFDDFVAARTAAAKDMGSAKARRPLAAEVRALPKPSVAAWTVNMLAARRPEALRELAGLGQSMRAAQSSLDAPELRRLGQERRRLLGGAVRAAQEVAGELGRKISPAIAAEVEATLRAATADAGAAAAVQSGRLLRALSSDGVDVVDLSGAVALPGLVAPAPPGPPPSSSEGARPAATRPKEAEQPRLRAVRPAPRKTSPSALERARSLHKDAEEAAGAAAEKARQGQEELAALTALTAELSDTVRGLREQLARREQELKAAGKRRELALAEARQAARAAEKAKRTADLARERVLRLGNTPDP